jgi:iron(III) transport system substrate-binding protein
MVRRSIVLVSLVVLASACTSGDPAVTVYSGRSEELVGPLIERFVDETGIDVEVRYGDSTELAATLREEGENSPADVFFAQDPASLGAVAQAGLFGALPGEIMERVPATFSDPEGRWVGTSGRVRTVVYNTGTVAAADLPATVDGFTDPAWQGRLGIAPGNGSFLAFVAAMVLIDGEEAAREWLDGIAANEPLTYASNSTIVAAVDDGEVDAGLVNHYYLLRRMDELGEVDAANYFFPTPNPGSLVIPAGAGILASSDDDTGAVEFIRYLLSDEAQAFFATETFEYPLVDGTSADPALPALETLAPPSLDLSRLATALDRATDLVAEAGLL